MRWLAILVFLMAISLRAVWSESLPTVFQEVTVEPTRTSIYVGSVGLRMPPFERTNGEFRSTYRAKVRPYFFASEAGAIRIALDDGELLRLAAGETVEFHGEGVNEEGDRRPVTGRAVPSDARSGKLKVRVRVSPRIELIFNTTYRFTGPSGDGSGSKDRTPVGNHG